MRCSFALNFVQHFPNSLRGGQQSADWEDDNAIPEFLQSLEAHGWSFAALGPIE